MAKAAVKQASKSQTKKAVAPDANAPKKKSRVSKVTVKKTGEAEDKQDEKSSALKAANRKVTAIKRAAPVKKKTSPAKKKTATKNVVAEKPKGIIKTVKSKIASAGRALADKIRSDK